MNCTCCNSEDLVAMLTVTIPLKPAMRNGTVKVGSVKFTQMDMKHAWDTVVGPEGVVEKAIKGPFICNDCGTEHFYICGDKAPLRAGSYAEAVQRATEQAE